MKLESPANSVRCPFCLNGVQTSQHLSSSERETCSKCDRTFRVKDGLAPSKAAHDEADVVDDRPGVYAALAGWDPVTRWVYVGVVALVAVVFLFFYMKVSGPTFLKAWGVLFLALLVGSIVLRFVVEDSWFTSAVACGGFLGVAAVRFMWGVSHGLHTWDTFVSGVLIGGFLFFARADSETSSGIYVFRSSGSYGSSCSSSCGGGCGGGCGGCGGCS